MLADRSGLTAELSTALRRRSFTPVHDRGRVLVDVAVMLSEGGEAICDIEVLRHQAPALGPVASAPTVWRAFGGKKGRPKQGPRGGKGTFGVAGCSGAGAGAGGGGPRGGPR